MVDVGLVLLALVLIIVGLPNCDGPFGLAFVAVGGWTLWTVLGG